MDGKSRTTADPYTYARDHDRGPGQWCVIGPNDWKMHAPDLDKCRAYSIGKILSGEYGDAISMLQSLLETRHGR